MNDIAASPKTQLIDADEVVSSTNTAPSFAIFPVQPKGKLPATEHGFKDASRDSAQQEKWWGQRPDANIGIPTGLTNGIVVIDIDPKHGGLDSLRDLEGEYGCTLPKTVTVETGGDGLHYYFDPEGIAIGSRNGWRPGIDIKGEGGYVVGAESTHETGKKYRFAKGRAFGQVPLAKIPDWLLAMLPRKDEQPSRAYRSAVAGSERNSCLQRAQAYVAKAAAVGEGARNDAAFQLAGHVAAIGTNGSTLGESEIVSLLGPWNLRNNPPLPDDELRQCISSALKNGTPRPAKEQRQGMADLRQEEYREQPQREITYKRITSAELASGDYTVDFLIDHTLVAKQPLIIAGPQKTLKTSLLVDAAVSLSIAGCFLGRLPVARRRRVAVMSGESGLASLQETARRICSSAGWRLADCDGLIWSPDLPRFGSLDHLDALEKFIRADDIDVLGLDPAYLTMPGADAGNLLIVGEMLRSMSDLCQRLGVTLMLAHHTRKNTGRDPYEPMELQDIAWAGFAEFARQWWLLNRREKYEPGTGEHRLWLSVGGSAGHSALWALDIREGRLEDPGGRIWDVDIGKADEARMEATERRKQTKAHDNSERSEADQKSICEAIAALPGQRGTKTDIRDASGLNTGRFDPVFARLIRDKRVVKTTITKGNKQTYDAYTFSNNDDEK